MILAVLPEHRGEFAAELHAMHQLRYRVFHERLQWEVTTVGDLELDEFDAMSPIYLIYKTDDGVVAGSARLLPTTGPTMLGRTFPILLNGASVPVDAKVWEASRFAVDLQSGTRENIRLTNRATLELFLGLIEIGLRLGWEKILSVTDLRLEKLGQHSGLQFERYGPPHQIGRTQAVAGFGRVCTETLDAVRGYAGLTEPVLTMSGDLVTRRLAA